MSYIYIYDIYISYIYIIYISYIYISYVYISYIYIYHIYHIYIYLNETRDSHDYTHQKSPQEQHPEVVRRDKND